MKRALLLIFFCIHLGFLVFNNAVMTRETHVEFFERKGTRLDTLLSRIIRHPAFLAYGRITGLETGYGFFGFNVRSTGFVITENCGQAFYPEFQSLEAENRYSGLRGAYIDYLKYKHPIGRTTSPIDSLQEDYLDLVLKNVAAFSLKGKALACDSTFTGYYILEVPTLKEASSGAAPSPSLVPVKKFAYVVRDGYPR